MDIEEIIKLHKHAIYNRKDIEQSNNCGCFYCKKIFYPSDITEWTDKGQTAICPYCGVDSVICNKDNYEITKEDLKALYKYYFLDDPHEKI